MVNNSLISICGGEAIVLGTPVQGTGLTYSWTGPCGFTSSLQYPLPIQNAGPCNAGDYTLIISDHGCQSDTVTVTVVLKPKPVQPQIVGNTKFCEGATVTLLCGNYTSTMPYLWIRQSTMDTTITTQNSLTLPNIMVSDSGFWQLTVESGGCYSDPSPKFRIQVQAYPNVTAAANTPLCSGGTLQLMATGSSADSIAWTWTGPNGFIRFEKNPTRKPAVAGPYTVVGKTSFGCADTATVNVVIVPTPMIDTVTNNAPVCVSCNSNAMLQAIVQPIYGPLTYMWSGPNFSVTNTQPSVVIPGICTANNGIYHLVIKDTFGCLSPEKQTIVKVQKIPDVPLISATSYSVCQGDSVTFKVDNANAYTGTVQYNWTFKPSVGPVETTTTFIPNLTIGPVSAVNAGNYSVQVQVDSCISPISAIVHLTVKPIPNAPVAKSPDHVLCEGETLIMFADPASSNNAYDWISNPPGFFNASPNPIIPSVDTSYTRDYLVRVTVNNCVSDYSEPLHITVNPQPAKPFLLPLAAVCKNDPTTIIKLKVLTGTPGAKYQFFNAHTHMALGAPVASLTFQITDVSSLQPGQDSFYVQAILDSCTSLPSNIQVLQVDTVPNITAYAGPDIIACETQQIFLNATAPNPGNGTWTPAGGPTDTIVDPNNNVTQVLGIKIGSVYFFKWSISNGTCKNYSSDIVQVEKKPFEMAHSDSPKAGMRYDGCRNYGYARCHHRRPLDANQPTGTVGGYY